MLLLWGKGKVTVTDRPGESEVLPWGAKTRLRETPVTNMPAL